MFLHEPGWNGTCSHAACRRRHFRWAVGIRRADQRNDRGDSPYFAGNRRSRAPVGPGAWKRRWRTRARNATPEPLPSFGGSTSPAGEDVPSPVTLRGWASVPPLSLFSPAEQPRPPLVGHGNAERRKPFQNKENDIQWDAIMNRFCFSHGFFGVECGCLIDASFAI